jgi:hypothetical protein
MNLDQPVAIKMISKPGPRISRSILYMGDLHHVRGVQVVH